MELDKTQLQWVLAGAGFVVVALIFLWGNRDRLRKRRRQPSLGNEPVFGDPGSSPPESTSEDVYEFGGRIITPDSPLAKDALVDVEIRPFERENDSRSFKLPDDSHVTEAGNTLATEQAHDNIADQHVSIDESVEPLEALPEKNDSVDESVSSTEQAGLRSEKPAPPPQMTVVLTIVAPQGSMFLGPEILVAAENAQLSFSDSTNGLFARLENEGVTEGSSPIFSMAHLHNPGIFDLQTLDSLATPGLLLFMQLPGALEEMKALDLFTHTADQIAIDLGGTVCDERRHQMTRQAWLHLRGKVADLSRRRRMWIQTSQ